MTEVPEPTRRTEPIWLEPFPDILLEGIPDQAPKPEARYEAKEARALLGAPSVNHSGDVSEQRRPPSVHRS